jgi:alpha-N-arabinofuranosidase
MTRRRAWIAAVAWVVACACTPTVGGSQLPPEGENLVANASFEEAGGDAPRGWTFEARAAQKGKASTVRANAHTGEYSLKLEPNSRNKPWDIASNPVSIGQAFPAAPLRGKTLSVTGWLGAEGNAVAVAAVYALRSDGGVTFVRLEQDSSRRGLVFHEDTFQVPNDSKVQYVIVNLAVEATEGAAYFDDISVSVGGSRRPAAPTARAGTRTDLRSADIVVDASREIRRIPRTIYGSNIEWIWNANGIWDVDRRALNADLVRLSRDAGFSLLRFPGGVFADFYHWRDGVGPQTSRRETEHSPGGPRSAHVFGTDEALAFAKATNSELLITVNAGTGTAAEAADWVRYINKSDNAAQRVTYWEIGNELYIKDPKFVSITPTVYLNKVREFARAMREVDPSIKIAAISDENYPSSVQPAYRGWTDEVLRGAGKDIDLLAVHNAYAPMVVADKGEDVRTVYAAMLAAPSLIKKSIDNAARKIQSLDAESARRIKLAVTEWGPFFHVDVKSRFVDHVKTLGSGLFAASVLKVLIESPAVEVANAFKLVDPLFMGWIGRRPDGTYVPTGPYYALELFTRHFGERAVESTTNGPTYDGPAVGWVDRVPDAPSLDIVASRSEDGKTLYVIAVNKDFDRPITGRLTLKGFTPAGIGTAWTLNGAGIDANTGSAPVQAAGVRWARQASDAANGRFERGGPTEVTLTSLPLAKVAATFEYSFPAHSVTSLEIRGQ